MLAIFLLLFMVQWFLFCALPNLKTPIWVCYKYCHFISGVFNVIKLRSIPVIPYQHFYPVISTTFLIYAVQLLYWVPLAANLANSTFPRPFSLHLDFTSALSFSPSLMQIHLQLCNVVNCSNELITGERGSNQLPALFSRPELETNAHWPFTTR